MKILKKITLALSVLALALSCTSEEEQNLYAGQEKIIEDFIKREEAKNPEMAVVSNGGSERLTLVPGEGEALEKDGTVDFYYAGYQLTSQGISKDKFFGTNKQEIAEVYQWEVSDSTVFRIISLSLKDDKPVEGLKNGLVGVKKGEECYILFTTRNAFGSKKMPGIPINSGLIYHIWVDKVDND